MKKLLLVWLSVLPFTTNSIARLLKLFSSCAHFPLKKIVPLWVKRSHFQRNIIIGTCIAIFITLFHDFSFIREMEDKAMDLMIKINQSDPRVTTENTAISGYVFVDIDQETYQQWDEPFHTPRNHLLSLIQLAVDYAKIVVVDIDLSKAGIDPDADQRLVDFLQSYSRKNSADLILMRRLFPESNQLKPLFFPEESLSEKVRFGLPNFEIDGDHQVRRWTLSKQVCEDSQPLRIGSVQLLADMIALKAEPEKFKTLRGLHQDAQCPTNKNAPLNPPEDLSKTETFDYDERKIDLAAHGIGERLIYTIPANDQRSMGKGLKIIHTKSTAYMRYSAADLLRAGDPSFDFFKDTIVVIGSSYAESGDIHATPLGEMPGPLILINAIKSFNQWGQITTPPPWIKWLIEALLIVFIAWVYAWANSFWGTLLVGITILAVFVPVSFWFFKAGMWVDFALPVFGMQLHQLIAEHEEKIILKAQKVSQTIANI